MTRPILLFIDDERDPSQSLLDSFEVHVVRSSLAAIGYVAAMGMPDRFQFDHDLGSDDTAMHFIAWLTSSMLDGNIPVRQIAFDVHSRNPVGAGNIEGYLRSWNNFVQRNNLEKAR